MPKLSGLQKKLLILDKTFFSQEEKYLLRYYHQDFFQAVVSISFHSAYKFFFFSHENRKYGECDLISLLGKGTITKDIFI